MLDTEQIAVPRHKPSRRFMVIAYLITATIVAAVVLAFVLYGGSAGAAGNCGGG